MNAKKIAGTEIPADEFAPAPKPDGANTGCQPPEGEAYALKVVKVVTKDGITLTLECGYSSALAASLSDAQNFGHTVMLRILKDVAYNREAALAADDRQVTLEQAVEAAGEPEEWPEGDNSPGLGEPRENCTPLVPMAERPAFAEPAPEPEVPKPIRKGGKGKLKPHPDNTPVEPASTPTPEPEEWPEGDDSPGLGDEGEPEPEGEGDVELSDPRSILERAAAGLT